MQDLHLFVPERPDGQATLINSILQLVIMCVAAIMHGYDTRGAYHLLCYWTSAIVCNEKKLFILEEPNMVVAT